MHSVLDLLLTEVQPTLCRRRGIVHLRHEILRPLGAVWQIRVVACVFTAVAFVVVACTLTIGLIIVVVLATRALWRAQHRQIGQREREHASSGCRKRGCKMWKLAERFT